MKRLLFAAMLLVPSLGCAQLSGTTQLTGTTYLNAPVVAPTVSNVQNYSTATTIGVSFSSGSFATPGFSCTPAAGGSAVTAKDNGTDADSPINHVQVVVSLPSSTSYNCTATASNSAGSATPFTFSIATKAVPTSTPFTSESFSTPVAYNSISSNWTSSADTNYNACSNDGNCYFTVDDTSGWYEGSTNPNASTSGNTTIGVFVSTSPLEGVTFNMLPGLGTAGSETTYDSRSVKDSGLYAMDKKLFMWLGGQQNACCGLASNATAYPQSGGNIAMSADHGVSWNNFQNIGLFLPGGKPPTAAMFPTSGAPTTMGSCTFVMDGPDDGTLGYFNALNQYDQMDAYVYLICNDGYWNNGNSFYLARVLRALLAQANPSNYQWYVSGDGNQDSSWTSNIANAQPVLTNTGELGEAACQAYMSRHRFVCWTFFYPGGLAPSNPQKGNTTWLTYEMQHLWGNGSGGGWNLINTTTNLPGYYNPIPLAPTTQTGLTTTLLTTGDFGNAATYAAYMVDATLN